MNTASNPSEHASPAPNQYPEPIGPVERITEPATEAQFKIQFPVPEYFATDRKPAPHWEEGQFAEQNDAMKSEVRSNRRNAEAKLAQGLRLAPSEYNIARSALRGVIHTYITPAEKADHAKQIARHRG